MIGAFLLIYAAAAPLQVPSARDLYIGCSLFVRQDDVLRDSDGRTRPYSATTCGLQAIMAITDREGRSNTKDNRLRFCLPGTAEASRDPATAMAYAYIDYFERVGSRLPGTDGRYVYVAAMIDKWPCPLSATR